MDIKYTLPFDLTNTKYSNKMCVCCVCAHCMHACVCVFDTHIITYVHKMAMEEVTKKIKIL